MYKYLLILLTFLVPKCVGTSNSLQTIQEQGPITKMTLKVASHSGIKEFAITDTKKLDTINKALIKVKQIDVLTGGALEIWADIFIFKNGKKANLFVGFSQYNGWFIEIGSDTFACGYIFNLIKYYSINGPKNN
jgi:hypothetical protein